MLASTIYVALLLALHAQAARKFWLTKADKMNSDLVEVQAFVVKDEDVPKEDGWCRADGGDARYSDKRYLMCAGSILTGRHVLTSASCIHEATHVRHNIRAPLAVVVSAFSSTAQVIRVSESHVHPNHVSDPRDRDHALHNVAVLKLACRIFKNNLHKVELPTQPFADECAEESCLVAVIRRTNQLSFTMYETRASNVEYERNVITKMEKPQGHAIEISNKNALATDNKVSKFTIEIPTDPEFKISRVDKNNEGLTKNSLTTNEGDKKLWPRSSHGGASGCPHTGSPVMLNKTQYGIVASSCDDRQPEITWRYTDVFENVDWIDSVIKARMKVPVTPDAPGCSSCIYNIHLEFGCQDECRNSSTSVCGLEGVHLPGIELPKCPGNQTEIITVGNFNPNRSKKKNEPEEMPTPLSVKVAALYKQFLGEQKRDNRDSQI